MSRPADDVRLSSTPALLKVYAFLAEAAGPFMGAYLRRRAESGKEDPARLPERYGVASAARPDGTLIWFHAASVGEAMSLTALIDRVLAERPGMRVLVTTGTVTSARMVAARLGDRVIHQYVPLDRGAYVKRFLDHWRPDLAVWIESELWPNLVTQTFQRGIPAALINARMSARSTARWQKIPGTIAALLGGFDLVLTQTPKDATTLSALGAPGARYVGHLKYAADPLPAAPEQLRTLKAAISERRLWVLASSHEGEEEMAIQAHRAIAKQLPGLLTVIVPRHTARAESIAATASAAGLKVSRRSAQPLPATGDDVHIVDTMGELGLWYRLTPVACIGGSLVRVGGHNPIEAAQLDCALIFGPHMFSVQGVADELLSAGAAETVADAAGLAHAVTGLLQDPPAASAKAEAGCAVAERNSHVIDHVFVAMGPLLDRALSGTAS